MAIYHFSASVVSRSTGRSAVAAAAYRSASQLEDERYGIAHDYTRKGGVVHAEILAPEDTPEWMHDRAQLWNAVEKIETRKNAQLAREITLALPHELSADERRDLVRQFAHEQFVSRGMIADIAIHDPHRQGDNRNHHAHIMLTMRELTGDGFHAKKATPEARRWNSQEALQEWRTAWAAIQNREFERLGIAARVDHRSFDEQGIDREPTQHEGPAATNKKRRGELSEVAQENDGRTAANENAADLHAELMKVRAELDELRSRQAQLVHEKETELEAQQFHTRLEVERRQDHEKAELAEHLIEHYRPHLVTVQAEAERVTDRLESSGILRSMLRDFSGRTRADRERLDKLQATIADTHKRMQEQQGALAKKHRAELERLETRFQERQEEQRRSILEVQQESAREAAEGNTKPTYAQRLAARAERLQERAQGIEKEQGKDKSQSRDKGRDFEM